MQKWSDLLMEIPFTFETIFLNQTLRNLSVSFWVFGFYVVWLWGFFLLLLGAVFLIKPKYFLQRQKNMFR